MKKFLTLIGVGLMILPAWGMPAKRGLFTVRQPDGTELQVQMRGDAFSKQMVTVDGRPVRLRDTGWYELMSETEIAEKSASVAEIRQQQANSVHQAGVTRGPGLFDYSFPVKGTQKGLVILVQFKDVKFNSKNNALKYADYDAKSYFTGLLNTAGFSEYSCKGSARDWFVDNSKGQFVPEFDVFGPVTLANNMSYYGGNSKSTDRDQRPAHMVAEACKALDKEIDFSQYDRDGDGYVDNVYVFYAGYGEADSYGEVPDAIWPHSWELSSAGYAKTVLDGVRIDRYACSNETDYTTKSPDAIGTFVHEFSHVMGLPDLYCTDYELPDQPFTPGAYSVMDYGPYNNGGKTPPNYSAYERYALDWLVPEEITVSGTYKLESIADSNKAYIIKTDKTNEFFLLECRKRVGWDAYIPGAGMLVWHVDYNTTVFFNNKVNNTKDHQYVDLVEADNTQTDASQSGDVFPGSSGKTSFSFTTTPALKSWSGKDLGIALSNIKYSTSSGVSFTAEVTPSGVTEVTITEGFTPGAKIYDLQGIQRGTVTAEGLIPTLQSGLYVVEGRKVRI